MTYIRLIVWHQLVIKLDMNSEMIETVLFFFPKKACVRFWKKKNAASLSLMVHERSVYTVDGEVFCNENFFDYREKFYIGGCSWSEFYCECGCEFANMFFKGAVAKFALFLFTYQSFWNLHTICEIEWRINFRYKFYLFGFFLLIIAFFSEKKNTFLPLY